MCPVLSSKTPLDSKVCMEKPQSPFLRASVRETHPAHINGSFQKMLPQLRFTFDFLLPSFSLVLVIPAGGECLSVPADSYKAFGCSGEKVWWRGGGWKRVRPASLPPKAGQLQGKYIYISEEKRLGNRPGEWGTWQPEGSPSPWAIFVLQQTAVSDLMKIQPWQQCLKHNCCPPKVTPKAELWW